jgi:PAS domain S-box-containing protein
MSTSLQSHSRKTKKKPALPAETATASRIIGQGEMADLVRAFDWSRTPVGHVEGWSDTLVTTVNLLLASRHPMFLWWGSDLIQFYNDGYRPSIRSDKHPSALGQPGLECWPEIWPIIGPQIEAVMHQGHSTWNTNQLVSINRNGKPEEVFWTYGYSPVRDKDGVVQGTLVVCSETTEQVLSERRLRALLGLTADSPAEHQDSQSRTLQAFAQSIFKKIEADPADIPFASLHLLAGDQIFQTETTVSNRALADAGNWPIAQTLRSKTPLIIGDLQTRFGDLILQPWPEPVTRACLLPLAMPGLSVGGVLVFGISPRLPFDDSYQTFFKLLAARIAGLLQSEIQESEIAQAAQRFKRLAEANPFGMLIGDLHGKLDYINPAFLKTLGYAEADVAAGRMRWDVLTPLEYAAVDAHAVQQLRDRGHCDVYEKAFTAKDGRLVPVLVGATIIDTSARVPEIAAFVTDLTPLKHAQEALRNANAELEKKVVERTAALQAEISDRKRAEVNLRELTGRLLLTQDEERRHMARELHDHAGQTLVALSLNFAALIDAAKSQDPALVSLVVQSQELSDGLSKEIRTLSYLLHPPLLDEAGLNSALQWYVEGFSNRSGIQVDLFLPEDSSRIPKALESVVFRVVQESLTNIHRHSGSPWASIRLTRSSQNVQVEIADRGRGIPPEKQRQMTAPRVGVGVRGMEERLRQFGGTLHLQSSSAGTTVTAIIPLEFDSAI